MGFTDFIGDLGKEAYGLVRDPGNALVDLVTGYDLNERDRVRDEQAAGNAERDEIYLQQAGLYGRFGGEFDAPALGSPEAFETMSHEDIKAAVDAMNGGSLRASAEGWTKIGESLEQALNDFRDFITHETEGKWEGIAKDSAVAATNRYVTESGKLAEAGTLIGTKITEAATGVDQVKATLPPVAERGILESGLNRVLPSVGILKRVLHDQDEAHQQAIEIMRTVYTPVMQQADTNVPRLPEPPRIGDGPTDLDGTQPGGGAPGSGGSNPYAPHAGPNSGSPHKPTPMPGAPLPGGTPGAGSAPGGAGAFDPAAAGAEPGASDRFAPNPNLTDAVTTPASAWTAPAAASGGDGTRLGQSGLGTSGSGIGGYSAGAGGLGSGLGGGSGAGSLGGYGSGGILSGGIGSGSGSGSVGGTGATAATTSGSGAAGARPGAAGAGMMPGAGARGRGDDESEHKTPGYLVNVDNGSELIGKLPLAAPPVIGS